MEAFGRLLLLVGLLLLIVGGSLIVLARVGWPLGRLPGDIRLEGKHFSFYVPLATSLLLSLVLTALINLIARLWRK